MSKILVQARRTISRVISHKFLMTFFFFLVQYSEIINVLYTLYMPNMPNLFFGCAPERAPVRSPGLL